METKSVSIQTFDETIPDNNAVVFDDSNTPGVQQLTPNDKAFRRVDQVIVTNNDTIDHVVQLRVNILGDYYWIGSATIPAGAGFGGGPGIDLVAAALPATVTGLSLYSFQYLEAYVDELILTGDGVWVTAIGGLF